MECQEPWPDLKLCLRPLIAIIVELHGIKGTVFLLSYFVSLRRFVLQIYLLTFTLFNKFDFNYEMIDVRVKNQWGKLNHTPLNL